MIIFFIRTWFGNIKVSGIISTMSLCFFYLSNFKFNFTFLSNSWTVSVCQNLIFVKWAYLNQNCKYICLKRRNHKKFGIYHPHVSADSVQLIHKVRKIQWGIWEYVSKSFNFIKVYVEIYSLHAFSWIQWCLNPSSLFLEGAAAP